MTEDTEKTLRSVIDKLSEDVTYWKSECMKARKELADAEDIMLDVYQKDEQRSLFK